MYGRRISFSGSIGRGRSGRGRRGLSERDVVRVDRGRGRRLLRLSSSAPRSGTESRPSASRSPGRTGPPSRAPCRPCARPSRSPPRARRRGARSRSPCRARPRLQGLDDLVGLRRGRGLRPPSRPSPRGPWRRRASPRRLRLAAFPAPRRFPSGAGSHSSCRVLRRAAFCSELGDEAREPDVAESHSVASLPILIKDRQGVPLDVLEDALEPRGPVHLALRGAP